MSAARTLLLTPWYSPHKILSWRDAITMLYTGDVDVVEEHDERVSSPSLTMRIPAVVRLKRLGQVKRGIKYSKLNVFLRDGFRCQYCGEKGTLDTLTRDHVVPRCRGGQTSWENVVTACRGCNERKDDRTPEQARMPLLSKPQRPKTLPMSTAPIRVRDAHPKWVGYLGGAAA